MEELPDKYKEDMCKVLVSLLLYPDTGRMSATTLLENTPLLHSFLDNRIDGGRAWISYDINNREGRDKLVLVDKENRFYVTSLGKDFIKEYNNGLVDNIG